MLAEIVFVLDVLGGGHHAGANLTGEDGHFGHLLQHHRMIYVLPPGEGAVAGANHTGYGGGLDAPLTKGVHNHYHAAIKSGQIRRNVQKYTFCRICLLFLRLTIVINLRGRISLNIVQLECFLAVADYLNFAKAAKQMNISQPAVTPQIQSLENELGVK